MNEWYHKCWTRDGAPHPREVERCCCSCSGMMGKSFWGSTTVLEDVLHLSQAFCRWPPGSAKVLPSPCHAHLEADSMILGKINRQELLLQSPGGLFTPPGPPSGLLAQASASLFPVKLILERGHHKINNEIMRILHHLAGLFSPYQRAASRGHLRPPGDVPSSLLPSPAPYISDLITCETQSGGLQCYPITKSRFIWTWEAERGFMIRTAPFLSVNLFVTFIPRNFLSFLTPLHLFLTIQ